MGIKLSVSNIAWASDFDEEMYSYLKSMNVQGLEIAPTRVLPETPYDRIEEIREFSEFIKKEYGLVISSMQSIWYGRNEKIFGDLSERNFLYEYSCKAIDFAEAAGIKNLVFGCPKNRCINKGSDYEIAVDFFKRLGKYALQHNTVIGMEANPTIYGTNFITCTEDAIKLIRDVDSKGFLLNLDVGTMINNEEKIEILSGNIEIINHVHISEPFLKRIEKRDIHQQLFTELKEFKYEKYISIEMGKESVSSIKGSIEYLKALLGGA